MKMKINCVKLLFNDKRISDKRIFILCTDHNIFLPHLLCKHIFLLRMYRNSRILLDYMDMAHTKDDCDNHEHKCLIVYLRIQACICNHQASKIKRLIPTAYH